MNNLQRETVSTGRAEGPMKGLLGSLLGLLVIAAIGYGVYHYLLMLA